MEDAMIINKSAYDRGFKHGTVYKVMTKKLNEGFTKTGNKAARYRLLNTKLVDDQNLIKNQLTVKGKLYPD